MAGSSNVSLSSYAQQTPGLASRNPTSSVGSPVRALGIGAGPMNPGVRGSSGLGGGPGLSYGGLNPILGGGPPRAPATPQPGRSQPYDGPDSAWRGGRGGPNS